MSTLKHAVEHISNPVSLVNQFGTLKNVHNLCGFLISCCGPGKFDKIGTYEMGE